MRISDWSSDVCSSDLIGGDHLALGRRQPLAVDLGGAVAAVGEQRRRADPGAGGDPVRHLYPAGWHRPLVRLQQDEGPDVGGAVAAAAKVLDRKSTRLNSSH